MAADCNLMAGQHLPVHGEGTLGTLAPVIKPHTLVAQLALHRNPWGILQG